MEWHNEERLVLYVVVGMRAVLDDIQRDTCVARTDSLDLAALRLAAQRT